MARFGLMVVCAAFATTGTFAVELGLTPTTSSEDQAFMQYVAGFSQRFKSEKDLNECFTRAYTAMGRGGCRSLEEGGKRRLAIYFANCHLEITGRETYPCPPEQELRECTRIMDATAYTEFSAYTRHVDVLCYTIESKVWREETAQVVQRLLSGANDTAQVLSKVIYASEELRQQHAQAMIESAKAHRISSQLVEDVTLVKGSLSQYSEGVQKTIEDARSSYGLVAEMLVQLAGYSQAMLSVQGMLAKNVMYVQSAAFYLCAGLLAWALSGGPRTAHTRPWLYLALIACAVAEMWVISRWGVIAEMTSAAGFKHLSEVPRLLMDRVQAFGWLPSPNGSAAGTNSTASASPFVSWRVWLFGVLASSLSWLGSAQPVFEPSLLRFSWDRPSQDSWDQSALCWGLRYAYCAYALTMVLHAALSFTDYSKLSFRLLTKLEQEVDRLSEASSSSPYLPGAFPVPASAASAPSPSPAAIVSGSHAALVALADAQARGSPGNSGSSRGGVAIRPVAAFEADDLIGDSDWDPNDPDNYGLEGNTYAAMASAASASASGSFYLTTSASSAANAHGGSSGGGGRNSSGHRRGASVLVPYGGSASSSSSDLSLSGSGTGLNWAVSCAAQQQTAGASPGGFYDVNLRPRSSVYRPNALVAYESPAAFAQLAHVQWLTSLTTRIEQVTSVPAPSANGDDDSDANEGMGLADDWSDSDGSSMGSDDEEQGMVGEAEEEGGDFLMGPASSAAAAIVDSEVSDSETDETMAASSSSGAGAMPVASPEPAAAVLTGRKRGRGGAIAGAAVVSSTPAKEPLDGTPSTGKGKRGATGTGARRGRPSAAAAAAAAASLAADLGESAAADEPTSPRPAKVRRREL